MQSSEDLDRQFIAFVLLTDYTMISFSSSVEPLRIANRLSGKRLYDWGVYSVDGEPVMASNGLSINVDGSVADIERADLVLVCAGVNVERVQSHPALAKQLRFLLSRGSSIGSVCTGSYYLAKAGFLNDYRCTIHWENINSFREEFPDIDVSSELYEVDRNRYTCAGGTAALDMMLQFVAIQHGHRLAMAIAESSLHHSIRRGEEAQRIDLRARLGITHRKLLDVVQIMENSIEDPLSCSQLASTVGLSSRQLERLFQKYLGCTPTRYYLRLRLEQAQSLLRQTSQPILQIAISCGFVSASHFTKCYREHFQRTPSEERRSLQ
ncbi:GlxA family transcriptional regulator [Coralliovum pocilloporae]|uniref:GlxA family transcriptional regulator n=1 Tax=Coralliovum pocilloporae TaxID=3066369 RepID=UPI003306A3F7